MNTSASGDSVQRRKIQRIKIRIAVLALIALALITCIVLRAQKYNNPTCEEVGGIWQDGHCVIRQN